MKNFLSAWLRAKNIDRWALMTKLVPINDAEHSFECSIIGHMLGVIDRDVFGNSVNPERIGMLGVYHEAGEVGGLGDINTKAKNFDDETKQAFKRLETTFEQGVFDSLPKELQGAFDGLITQDKKSREGKLCKIADDICALIEANRELKLGNFEYQDAFNAQAQKLAKWEKEFPCVDYFKQHFLKDVFVTVDDDLMTMT